MLTSPQIQLNIDSIISTLLQVKHYKPGKQIHLKQSDVIGLALAVKEIFMSQPMMLKLDAPIKIFGDIHGQYYDMLRLFEYGGYPPQTPYLFLGDYVDRGRQGIQTVCLLFAFKIKYPNRIHILRGNHESASITKIYGFFQQCKNKYNVKVWKNIIDAFNCMPVAAVIQQKILCMHGGLSPQLVDLRQIQAIPRPAEIPDKGLLCDLVWSDPDQNSKLWGESQRGISYVFGQEVIFTFLRKNQLDLICRAHQVVEDGYEFFAKKQLVTVFSAPNYCGEFNNSGAIMKIQADLTCSFQVLRPEEKFMVISRPKTPSKSKSRRHR